MFQASLLLAVCSLSAVFSRSNPIAGCQEDSNCYGEGLPCPKDFEMCICNDKNICEGLPPVMEGCMEDSDCYGPGQSCPKDFAHCKCTDRKICEPVLLTSPPPQYPTPAPVQGYNPDISGIYFDPSNVGDYGVNKEPYCHKVEELVFENQCEPYNEKTCWTENKEHCETIEYKNCTGVIETNVERVCFNVNELVCNLVEAIHYETLEETYQVQRCFTGKDRVCDTTFKIDTTTKDDYQCCNVETPNCHMEEQVINDVTCTNTVEFYCQREKTTKNDGYGQKEVVCKRTPKQDCYNIPRKIQVEVCKTDIRRYCEKFSNIFPFPVEEQNCHFEPKKICEFEMKTRPKKAKKYSYTKDCKDQHREICDQCEKKSIQPVCDMQERLQCTYVPKENCKDEAKQYCHKVEKVVVKEVCDMKFDTRYL